MRALITGITGQDGSILAEQLLAKKYEVFGLVRRLSVPNLSNIEGIRDKVTLIDGDLTDQSSLDTAVKTTQPDEVYNLAAQSFVGTSWAQPVLTGEITGLGCIRMLEAVRRHADRARYYQASSSEMFGGSPPPQNEETPFHPRSPYGVAKVMAYYAVVNYRESYGLFASNGILFNHESERRGTEFVTRKISLWTAETAAGRKRILSLGNGSTKRDWGYAPDYTNAMWCMLQYKQADDFVIATGETHTIEELVREAILTANLDPAIVGKMIRWNDVQHLRPAEVFDLRGDASKAKRFLGWEPTVRFHELVRRMVMADLKRVTASTV